MFIYLAFFFFFFFFFLFVFDRRGDWWRHLTASLPTPVLRFLCLLFSALLRDLRSRRPSLGAAREARLRRQGQGHKHRRLDLHLTSDRYVHDTRLAARGRVFEWYPVERRPSWNSGQRVRTCITTLHTCIISLVPFCVPVVVILFCLFVYLLFVCFIIYYYPNSELALNSKPPPPSYILTSFPSNHHVVLCWLITRWFESWSQRFTCFVFMPTHHPTSPPLTPPPPPPPPQKTKKKENAKRFSRDNCAYTLIIFELYALLPLGHKACNNHWPWRKQLLPRCALVLQRCAQIRGHRHQEVIRLWSLLQICEPV